MKKAPAQAGSVTPVIAFLQAPKRASSELTEKLQKFDQEAQAYWEQLPRVSAEYRAVLDKAMAAEIWGRPSPKSARRENG